MHNICISADSPSPSYPSQNRSNGASHMGSRGPAAPPGGGSTGPGVGQARLGQTGGGSGVSSGGGTSGGPEPTPMDMSIGPQPSQPMSAPHGMPVSVIYHIYLCTTPYNPTIAGLILTIKHWGSPYTQVMPHINCCCGCGCTPVTSAIVT